MRKTFRAILVEQEEEHVYLIKSIKNIHDDEIMGKITLALTPHKLIELKKDFFKPIRQNNDEFPNFQNTPTYCLKATLGLEVSGKTIVQNIATFANIFDEYLSAGKKGEKEETETDIDMEEGKEDASNQNHVGDKRVGDFMRELKKAREEQAKQNDIEVDVYESFATSHHGVSRMVGKPVRKGFYVVEHVDRDNRKIALVTGPFSKAPVNYDFEADVEPRGFNVVRESQDGIRVEFELEHDGSVMMEADAPIQNGEKMWEVDIYDSDTSKTYPVVVRAENETAARNKGMKQIADRENLSLDRLTAGKPDSKKN